MVFDLPTALSVALSVAHYGFLTKMCMYSPTTAPTQQLVAPKKKLIIKFFSRLVQDKYILSNNNNPSVPKIHPIGRINFFIIYFLYRINKYIMTSSVFPIALKSLL